MALSRILGHSIDFTHRILACLEGHIVAELAETDQGIAKGTHAIVADREAQHDHCCALARVSASEMDQEKYYRNEVESPFILLVLHSLLSRFIVKLGNPWGGRLAQC